MTVTTSATNPATGNALITRKQQTSVNPILVRCVCITAALVVTACGLLGLGLTCVLLTVVDKAVAPCPYHLTITVFSVAGGLLALSFVFFVHLCTRRKKLKRKAMLDELPGKEDAANYKKKLSVAGVEEVVMPSSGLEGSGEEKSGEVHPTAPLASGDEGDNFAMTQKSADVSYWIEQQKSEETHAIENFPLDSADGATKKEDQDCSDGEMTAL